MFPARKRSANFVRKILLFAEDAQVPASRAACASGWFKGSLAAPDRGASVLVAVGGSFTDGVDEGHEVVRVGFLRSRWQGESDYFPTARNGQSFGMGRTQIVTMRFSVGGQGAKHSSGIGVHEGECRDGSALTGRA